MSINLRLNMWFSGPVLFRGFLPETEHDFLQLHLPSGKRSIAVYLSDRQTQLSPFDVVPDDPEALKTDSNTINCEGLTLGVEIAEPDIHIMNALETGQPTEQSETLVQGVLDLAVDVHNGLVGYFRDIEKQYWLRPLVRNTYDHIHFVLNVKVHWLDVNGDWREFPRRRQMPDYPLESMISGPDATTGQDIAISRDKWCNQLPLSLERFLLKGKGAKTVDSLISNAYWHLQQLDTRLAIIEAVRALELYVKSRLPKALYNVTQTKGVEIEKEDIDRLFQKAGLTAVTLLVFGLMGQNLGLDSKDIEYIQKAVDLRNQILHFARETIELSEANMCVSAIHRATRL